MEIQIPGEHNKLPDPPTKGAYMEITIKGGNTVLRKMMFHAFQAKDVLKIGDEMSYTKTNFFGRHIENQKFALAGHVKGIAASNVQKRELGWCLVSDKDKEECEMFKNAIKDVMR